MLLFDIRCYLVGAYTHFSRIFHKQTKCHFVKDLCINCYNYIYRDIDINPLINIILTVHVSNLLAVNSQWVPGMTTLRPN